MTRSLRRKDSTAPAVLLAPRIKRQIDKLANCHRWPIRQALISEDWQTSLLAQVVIARQRPDNFLAVAIYLIDLGCMGLKSATSRHAVSFAQYDDILERFQLATPITPCAPELAAKVIETAIQYAASLDFHPRDPDFEAAKLILRGIDSTTCDIPVVCGRDGKPVYISGPHDDVQATLSHLAERVGVDGFEFVDGYQESFASLPNEE